MTRDELDRVEAFVGDYLVLPDEHAVTAVVLWVAHTHLLPLLDTTPRLAILSPEYGCGKSRLLEVLDRLCHDTLLLMNASPAFIFRRVDRSTHPPTLLIDEADTIWSPSAHAGSEDLRGLVNSGYRRGAVVGRVGGPNRDKLDEFNTFAAVALAGRGRDAIPESVLTRSVIVPMRKRAGEVLHPWKRREVYPRALDIREALTQWIAPLLDSGDELPIPNLPDVIVDRPLEVWEPLAQVAELAGGTWPDRCIAAALNAHGALSIGGDEMPLPRRLLADIRQVWTDGLGERVGTHTLLDLLNNLTDAPWRGFSGGAGITSYALAGYLREYSIRPADIRFGDGTRKGYSLDQFRDPWRRYLPESDTPASDKSDNGAYLPKSATSATSATTSHRDPGSDRDADYVADVADVADLPGNQDCQRERCISAAGASGWCHSHDPEPVALAPYDVATTSVWGEWRTD
jgi:hypothetical protein